MWHETMEGYQNVDECDSGTHIALHECSSNNSINPIHKSPPSDHSHAHSHHSHNLPRQSNPRKATKVTRIVRASSYRNATRGDKEPENPTNNPTPQCPNQISLEDCAQDNRTHTKTPRFGPRRHTRMLTRHPTPSRGKRDTQMPSPTFLPR